MAAPKGSAKSAGRAPAPPEQLRALREELARGLPRAVVIRGEERWFRDEAVRIACEAAAQAGLEVVRHDARDPDLDRRALLDDLSAAPMFASARCVVVRGAAVLARKEGDEEPAFVRAAQAWLAGESPPGMLVLDAEGLRADSALLKRAKARGGPALELRKLWAEPPPWDRNGDPRRTELVQWLLARAKERQVALTPDEAVYVCAATGNDLAALDGALARIAERGSEGVRALVRWEAGSAPWDVAESIARGDAARALTGLEALFRSGFAGKDGERETDRAALTAMLFGSLRGKAREGLAGARGAARGEDPLAAAGFQGHPALRDALAARIQARDAAQWERLLDDLVALERRARTGGEADLNELAAFALRWKVERRPTRR